MKLNLNEVGVIWVSKGGKLRQLKYYIKIYFARKRWKRLGFSQRGSDIYICLLFRISFVFANFL